MKFAVIVVDMLKDTYDGPSDHQIIQGFPAIIPRLQFLHAEARKAKSLIVFACDSYFREDFLFKGKMPHHAIRGTRGAEVIEELPILLVDVVLPKRRFNPFFKTTWI
jgi:nicotinamidase-related amidase